LPPDVKDALASLLLELRLHILPECHLSAESSIARSRYDVRGVTELLKFLAQSQNQWTQHVVDKRVLTPCVSTQTAVSSDPCTTALSFGGAWEPTCEVPAATRSTAASDRDEEVQAIKSEIDGLSTKLQEMAAQTTNAFSTLAASMTCLSSQSQQLMGEVSAKMEADVSELTACIQTLRPHDCDEPDECPRGLRQVGHRTFRLRRVG